MIHRKEPDEIKPQENTRFSTTLTQKEVLKSEKKRSG
jgi:hypothetical protein